MQLTGSDARYGKGSRNKVQPYAGQEHDPPFSEQTDRDRHTAAGDEGLRLAIAKEGLHPDVGPDRRRHPHAGAQAAQHRCGEGGDQGRQTAKEIWPDEPNKAVQKDVDARWTVKIGGKIRYRRDATPLPQIALPVFGYKSHIAIDRRFGFIRESAVTSASQADGRMLPRLVTTRNASSEVWADSAYRSRTNEKCLAAKMLVSRIQRRKPQGRPMPRHVARANAGKSAIRAAVEHVFANQKNRFGLFIRTIGLARAEAKLTLANIAYNFDRLIFHERARAMG